PDYDIERRKGTYRGRQGLARASDQAEVDRVVGYVRPANSRCPCDAIEIAARTGREKHVGVKPDSASVIGDGDRALRFQQAMALELSGGFCFKDGASFLVIVAKLFPLVPDCLQVLLIGGRP